MERTSYNQQHFEQEIKPMGIVESLLFFGVPAAALYLATHVAIPYLHRLTALPLVVCWYAAGGVMVFLPLFIAALFFYRGEGGIFRLPYVLSRFRLDRFSRRDLLWSLGGIALTGVSTAIVMSQAGRFIPYFSVQPSFMTMQPLSPGSYWILLAWLPMFFFNILGEGLFWRGYIFPRQELHFGERTWLIHGLLWLMFHVSFGFNLLITLIPIIFIISYAVQRTRNTWVDIFIHGFINGFGFIAVALGLV